MASIGEEFLTVAEVAELLKLNQQTVRKLDRRPHSASDSSRSSVRIRRTDFRDLLDRGYTANRSTSSGSRYNAEDFWSGEVPPEPPMGPEAG
jgi:excisionase family DNA binding protein